MEEGEPEKEEGKRGKEQRYVRRYFVTSVRLEKISFQIDKLVNLYLDFLPFGLAALLGDWDLLPAPPFPTGNKG